MLQFVAGNTVSNWVMIVPALLGALLTWQNKVELRYTIAFLSFFGKLWFSLVANILFIIVVLIVYFLIERLSLLMLRL